MIEDNNSKVQYYMRNTLATQKQQLINALENGLAAKVDFKEYQNS
jgi:hypothetical protein